MSDDTLRLYAARGARDFPPDSDQVNGGAPGIVGRITTATGTIGVDKFFMLQPQTLTGGECEGCTGTFTDLPTASIPVYNLGPGSYVQGDKVLARFVRSRYVSGRGGSSCTGTVTINVKCGGTNVASATVTISQGGTTYATGSTNGSGNFSTTALPASGTYDISVTKSGFATYTSTFVYSCANITVNVVLSSSSNVVAGRVAGCGGNLVGASVTVTQGVSTLGTGTTDGSGNYSITLSGWSSGAVTVTASKTRYASGSTSTTPSSCGATTTPSTIVLTPATDYYCDPCGGTVPIYKTLYLTQPWDGAIVALTAGGGGWSGTGTWTGTGYADCGSATTSAITITVNWSFNNTCTVTLQWNGCAAPNTSRNPISDAYASANPGSVASSFSFGSSPTHTNSPFSASSSLTGYMGGGSGTATITE